MAVFKRRGRWAVTTYDPETQGKRWVGTYGTKREAQDAEHAARLERRRGRRAEETVDAFTARWVDDYPRQPATNISNRERISKFARDFNGRCLNDIDRQEARAWALANPSRVAVVRSMFSDAVRDGVCESNPFLGLRLRQSRGRKDLEIPSDEQFDQLVTAAKQIYPGWGEHVFSHMIVFAAYTGLRPGELAGGSAGTMWISPASGYG